MTVNRKDWDEAMNLLDDSLINEADQYRPVNKKKKIIRKKRRGLLKRQIKKKRKSLLRNYR